MHIKRWKTTPALQGIFYMLLCCFCYGLVNTLSKMLVHNINPFVMTFYRHFFSLLILLPFIIMKRHPVSSVLQNSFSKFNFLRAICGLSSVVCWIYALQYMPATKVAAISYFTPVLTSFLAALIFKENLSFTTFIALMTGLLGVYIVTNLNIQELNFGVAYALGACFLWAFSSLVTKKLTYSQDAITIVFGVTFLITLMALPSLFFYPQLLSSHQILILLAIAASASGAQVLAAKAFAATTLTVVMPFDFSRLIFTHMLAIIMLNEQVTSSTLLGGLIIFIAGLLVLNREVKTPYLMGEGKAK